MGQTLYEDNEQFIGNPGFKTSSWETNIGIKMITVL